jgi:hypothetical protein
MKKGVEFVDVVSWDALMKRINGFQIGQEWRRMKQPPSLPSWPDGISTRELP